MTSNITQKHVGFFFYNPVPDGTQVGIMSPKWERSMIADTVKKGNFFRIIRTWAEPSRIDSISIRSRKTCGQEKYGIIMLSSPFQQSKPGKGISFKCFCQRYKVQDEWPRLGSSSQRPQQRMRVGEWSLEGNQSESWRSR